jgi:uncharacterized protein YndB with AHSA1/START domain
MTQNKDLKRLVRARMKKTGEAYTAARAQITAKPKAKPPASVAVATATAAAPPSDYAALAGMSDESVKAKTGCTWDRWVRALDHLGADRMSHRDIAALVNSKYKIDGWWSQSVAVGYERIKGLRVRGQARNGRFEATKSRTFDVPVTRLFEAWADATTRRRWLNGASVKVRTATAPKSIRLDWSDGDTSGIVAVGFTAKGKSKSAVALAHTKLPDRETADRLKQYWSERLDALGEVFAS